MAPAIARVDGMPRLELIFPHSKSADGWSAQGVHGPLFAPEDISCTSRSCRLSHAGAMQIISFCMAPFLACKLFRHLLGFWRARRDSIRTPDPQIRSLAPVAASRRGAGAKCSRTFTGHSAATHADRHGAVVMPIDKISAMRGALDSLTKTEARIIEAARASGATVERIKAAIRG